MKCIVKRESGECQPYDEKKIYGSVYAACFVGKMDVKGCEKTAEKVVKEVTKLVKGKKSVSSALIHKKATTALRKLHKGAALLFETHKDIN
jgi:transcriptional regulator NrdR family protein